MKFSFCIAALVAATVSATSLVASHDAAHERRVGFAAALKGGKASFKNWNVQKETYRKRVKVLDDKRNVAATDAISLQVKYKASEIAKIEASLKYDKARIAHLNTGKVLTAA